MRTPSLSQGSGSWGWGLPLTAGILGDSIGKATRVGEAWGVQARAGSACHPQATWQLRSAQSSVRALRMGEARHQDWNGGGGLVSPARAWPLGSECEKVIWVDIWNWNLGDFE